MKQTWLSMDPGPSNFAVTVFRYDPTTEGVKLLYLGMLANPLKNLTANPVRGKPRKGKNKDGSRKPPIEKDEPSFEIGYQLFLEEVEWLFEQFSITHVVGERFQSRGRFNAGDQSELVSIMLGTIYTIAFARGAKIITTIAGVWKAAFERLLGHKLQIVYDCAKMQYRMEPHMVDSTMIGLWHANKGKAWKIVRLLPKLRNLALNSGALS